MFLGARVAVVVPAFSESERIGRTLGTLPEWVDCVCVVDDCSRDETAGAVCALCDPRVRLLRHERNLGVGAAIATGYAEALAASADVVAVMAGDNQMDPGDLAEVVAPVALGEADYVKGNRFRHPERRSMPIGRRLAGHGLSALTRWATGLDVSDTQCGYTAISATALRRLSTSTLWPRYGYPNDLLGMLAARGALVREVPVRPVYQGERSGVRPWHALSVAAVILRRRWLEPPPTNGSPALRSRSRSGARARDRKHGRSPQARVAF